jgi:hypothetical protein
MKSFCVKNFPQQQLGESFLTTASFCTDVPRFASMRAECMSDKSLDTAALSVVKGNSPVPQVELSLIERLANRSHPEMKPPAFVQSLKIDTSNESAGRIVSLASLPFFAGSLTTGTTVTGLFGTKPASPQNRGFLNLEFFSTKASTKKPAYVADSTVRKPLKTNWGNFVWWVICGGDGTATIVPMS